jgi:hypothetical protein
MGLSRCRCLLGKEQDVMIIRPLEHALFATDKEEQQVMPGPRSPINSRRNRPQQILVGGYIDAHDKIYGTEQCVGLVMLCSK